MINENDIIDMTCLTRDEIAAIAEHEHLGDVQAAELGEYLMHLHHGPQRVQRMICEDISAAIHAGDLAHARALYATLRAYLADHPEALRGNA
jgi:ATP-dependent protease HslVU (ClpYQ) peptidase subunit